MSEPSTPPPGEIRTWLLLTVISPAAALTLFWFAVHRTSASINHAGGTSLATRVGLIVAIVAVPAVAIIFGALRWSRSSARGRSNLVAAGVSGIVLTYALGFVEIVLVWLSAMGT